jgi:hypothetical protein
MCKTDTRMVYGIYKGAGAKCDHQRIGVRVRANLDLEVWSACTKQSQLTPCFQLFDWKNLVVIK